MTNHPLQIRWLVGAPVTATTQIQSVRKFRSFQEDMQSYHAEIERKIFSAEIRCEGNTAIGLCANRVCPFAPSANAPEDKQACVLVEMRKLVGEYS